MPGYDWSFGGWERGRPRRGGGGYEWSRPPRETMGRPWGPRDVQYGRWEGPGGYDRGVYGEAYEAYSPGPRHGGGPRGAPRGRGWGGYGEAYEEEWQGGYARGPFIPEQAYRRHPELDRAPDPRGSRWGYELDDAGMELSDEQILQSVRRRLYEDVWLDVDRIDVEVEDGVVTLRGEVDDFLEVRYAWDDAWETEGVRGVVTQLTVRADEPQGQVEAHGDLVPQSTHGTTPEPRDLGGTS
jgi:BON domain